MPGHCPQKGSVIMLLRCIQAENMKLKHSVIYLAFIAIPIIPAIMGTFNYLQNLELLKSSWYSLWTQITLFMLPFSMRRSSVFTVPIPGGWNTPITTGITS